MSKICTTCSAVASPDLQLEVLLDASPPCIVPRIVRGRLEETQANLQVSQRGEWSHAGAD
jgi:hypothetical protein